MRHENGEGEMERHDMRTADTFLMSLRHACVFTRMKSAERAQCSAENVRATAGECAEAL